MGALMPFYFILLCVLVPQGVFDFIGWHMGAGLTVDNSVFAIYISREFPVDKTEALYFDHANFRFKEVEWESWTGPALSHGHDLDMTNHACIVVQGHGASEIDSGQLCVNDGASAVLLVIGFGNFPGFTSWTFGSSNFSVPMVEISLPGALHIYDELKNGHPVYILMEYDEEYNIWYEQFNTGVMIFFSVFLGLMTLSNVVIAIWRLANFISTYGLTFSLAQTIMAMVLVSNFFKLIYISIDPIFSRNIFGYMASQVLSTITFPISAITTLLITFYWHEVLEKTSARVYFNLHNKKFIIPAIIFSVGILTLELTTSILRGFQYNTQKLIYVNSGVFIAVLAIVNTYCIYIGLKVTSQVSKNPSTKKSHRTKKLKQTTHFIIASAVSTSLTIPFLVLTLTSAFRTPAVFIASYFFLYFFLTLGDLFKLFAFGIPASRIKTPSSSGSNGKSSRKSKKTSSKSSSSNPERKRKKRNPKKTTIPKSKEEV